MDDLTEKEQIENFRAWWADYGTVVIVGVVLGVAGLFGLNYYSTSKVNAEVAASVLYDEMADHVAEGRIDEAERVTGELETGFADSYYAMQAKLALTRMYMDANRDEDAANLLRELMAGGDEAPFASVARLRLAKILQYQEKFEEVLTLLEGQEDTGFTARFAEARGDALHSLGRFDEARAEYLVALADNDQTVDTTFLQLKLLDLPIPEAEAAVDVAPETDPLPAAETNPEAGAESGDVIEPGEETADAGLADANEPETP